MADFQIAVGSLIAGGLLSAAISWFFFHKSVDKKLSVYIQFASPVLGGIDDPEVRRALQIQYRDQKIDDLLPLQFVVANEGEKAIRDFIDPLSVTLPKTAKLLEARVIHIEPAGREIFLAPVELSDGSTRIELRFKLLNKGEFFFVKMLINGKLNPDELRFTLSVDDLPPFITPKSRPFAAIDEERTTGVRAILLGFVPLGVAVATSYGMVELSRWHPELFPGDARFHWLAWNTVAVAIWLSGIIYWLIRSTQLIVVRGFFGPKHHFHLPRPVQADELRHVMYDPRGRVIGRDYQSYLERHLFEERLSPDERHLLLRDLERRLFREDPVADEPQP